MADGQFPSLVSKSRDVNAVANPLWVELSDGTSALSVTDNALHIKLQDGGNALQIAQIDDEAALYVLPKSVIKDDNPFTVADNYVDAIGFLANDTTPDAVDEGDIGIARMTLDRKQLMVLADPTNDGYRLEINDDGTINTVLNQSLVFYVDDTEYDVAVGSVVSIGFVANDTTPDAVDEGDIGYARMTLDRKILTVIADPDTDANRLAVNTDGSVNVNVVSAIPNVNEVHNYDTSVNVGSDLTDNHDYPVPSDTFLLKSIIISASGNMKAEIQTGPLATLVTKAVIFLNGRQGDTQQVNFDPPIEVPSTSTGTVRIIRTNRQGAAMDVYSTIIGAIV